MARGRPKLSEIEKKTRKVERLTKSLNETQAELNVLVTGEKQI